MLFAYFMSCVASTATGAVECSNSYTEMLTILRKGDSCEVQAAELQRGAMNDVLIKNVMLVEVASQSGCGTFEQMKAKAAQHHFEFVSKGIKSSLFAF
jgi:hypothetical protein